MKACFPNEFQLTINCVKMTFSIICIIPLASFHMEVMMKWENNIYKHEKKLLLMEQVILTQLIVNWNSFGKQVHKHTEASDYSDQSLIWVKVVIKRKTRMEEIFLGPNSQFEGEV